MVAESSEPTFPVYEPTDPKFCRFHLLKLEVISVFGCALVSEKVNGDIPSDCSILFANKTTAPVSAAIA